MLVDVSKVDTQVELFGGWAEFPICVAPTAMQKMAHIDGEIANAKGNTNTVGLLHYCLRTETVAIP